MPMKSREMVKLLEDNGFIEVSQNGSHNIKRSGNKKIRLNKLKLIQSVKLLKCECF